MNEKPWVLRTLQISRLKIIKRTMFGRVGFELLKLRVLSLLQCKKTIHFAEEPTL